MSTTMSVMSPGTEHHLPVQDQRPAPTQRRGSEALAELLNLLGSIPSDPNFQDVEEIFNETARLQTQLQSKEKELEKVKQEWATQLREKQIAIKEVLDENESEKSKQREAISEMASLKKLIQEGKDTVAQKESEISLSEERYKKLQSTNNQLQSALKTSQRDIDTLQQRLKEKDVLLDKIKSAHSDNQKRLKDAEGRAKEAQKEKSALNTSLQDTKARLHQIEGYTTQQFDTNDDSMADAFVELWQHATTELHSYLNTDLSDQALQNRAIWDKFKRQSDFAVVPLPRSNSSAAKQMRLAIVLAILAREVDKLIFQPTYIVPEDSGIREVLADLAASDNEKESFCRSVLFSIYPVTQEATLHSRVQAVVRNVSSYLYEMFPDDQFSQLHASLEKIVWRAVDIWVRAQTSLQRYEPDFEPLKWRDTEWIALEFPEGCHAGSETNANLMDECLLTVFPRLTVVEKGNRFPLTEIVHLRRSQCIEATREVNSVPTSPVFDRLVSGRGRRRSSVSSSAGHANGTLPMKKKPQGS